jgi:hypothetical protein
MRFRFPHRNGGNHHLGRAIGFKDFAGALPVTVIFIGNYSAVDAPIGCAVVRRFEL